VAEASAGEGTVSHGTRIAHLSETQQLRRRYHAKTFYECPEWIANLRGVPSSPERAKTAQHPSSREKVVFDQ